MDKETKAHWFKKGQESVKRKNSSGCCCIIDDNGAVIKACEAHVTWKKDSIEQNNGHNAQQPQV